MYYFFYENNILLRLVKLSITFTSFTSKLKTTIKAMEFKRKFGRQKKSKPTKGLFLVILLALALFLWYNAESLLKSLF